MSVVGAIEPGLRKIEVERIKRKRPDSLDAYDLVLRALPFIYKLMPEGSAPAIPRGRANRRRPVTGSAASDKSVPIRPSRKQKRRNARSPKTKFWAVATDTDTDTLSTAATPRPR